MSADDSNPYEPPKTPVGSDDASSDGSGETQKTPLSIQARLCLMMFLQYFVQGCYLPIVSVYLQDALGFNSQQLGMFGSALAVGPLLAPFVLGQLVDRVWATQRVLALCHLSGGVCMLLLYSQSGFWPVVVLGTIYSVLYIPTMMLTNSLAFHHLKGRDAEFPIVRLFGTVGFVLPAWLIEAVWLSGLAGQELNKARGIAFCFAGVAGLLMAGYSMTLPHTPPQPRGDRKFAPAAVMGMMRFRYFAVLVVITFFVAIVHKFYFVWNSPYLKDVLSLGKVTAWEQRISSIGQISEVAVMAGLGLMVTRLGFKVTLAIGILAYMIRCVTLAAAISLSLSFEAAITIACVGQALHGLCFGCFLAAAFMFVDRVATPDIRGSMQNLYGTFVLGLGFFVGGFISGAVGDRFTTAIGAETVRGQMGFETMAGMAPIKNDQGVVEQVRDWPGIWLTCGALAALCLVVFWLLFPKQTPATEETEKLKE